MLAHFVRKLMSAAINWLLMSLVLYTFFMVYGTSLEKQACDHCAHRTKEVEGKYEHMYVLDKPWPLNYFVWLFDPSAPSMQEVVVPGGPGMGGEHYPERTYRFERWGLLRGDLSNYYGLELLLSFVVYVALTAFVAIHRFGHSPYSHLPYSVSIPQRIYLHAPLSTRAR